MNENPTSSTLRVAQQAFEHFQYGLATGEWQQFIDMLTDDFSLNRENPRGIVNLSRRRR